MCVQYWPASKEKDEEYGGIGVSVLKEEELANFHIRTIRLYKKNENHVSVFIVFGILPIIIAHQISVAQYKLECEIAEQILFLFKHTCISGSIIFGMVTE